VALAREHRLGSRPSISLASKLLAPSFANVHDVMKPLDKRRRMFIAFSLKLLAILSWVCFHDDSNASTEEVHMKIHMTNRQLLNLCTAAAAADIRALLG
jgi:hypothetical protein